MVDERKRLEPMLFFQETSFKKEFRFDGLNPKVETVWKEKPKCVRIRPPPLKYSHTMREWKNPAVPMELFKKPKESVRTDPRLVQQVYAKEPDHQREAIQKSRPRLVMTPAVSIDDIKDPNARRMLCTDMYTTDTAKALREAVVPHANIEAPLPDYPAPSNPIFLPKLQPPYVSPEWRMDTASWDGKRLRTYCDSTRNFWLDRAPFKCRACDEFSIIKNHRKMLRQMKSNKP